MIIVSFRSRTDSETTTFSDRDVTIFSALVTLHARALNVIVLFTRFLELTVVSTKRITFRPEAPNIFVFSSYVVLL
jgi:hypothetical protein